MLKYGTRYYMPDLISWTPPDPVLGKPMNPMSLNPYSYVGCNPVNATDVTGRAWSGYGDCVRSSTVLAIGVVATVGGVIAAPFTGGWSLVASVFGSAGVYYSAEDYIESYW